MMTTCAAIAGALPLAIASGDGTEMRRPLGDRHRRRTDRQPAADDLHDARGLPVRASLLEAPEAGQVRPAGAARRGAMPAAASIPAEPGHDARPRSRMDLGMALLPAALARHRLRRRPRLSPSAVRCRARLTRSRATGSRASLTMLCRGDRGGRSSMTTSSNSSKRRSTSPTRTSKLPRRPSSRRARWWRRRVPVLAHDRRDFSAQRSAVRAAPHGMPQTTRRCHSVRQLGPRHLGPDPPHGGKRPRLGRRPVRPRSPPRVSPRRARSRSTISSCARRTSCRSYWTIPSRRRPCP